MIYSKMAEHAITAMGEIARHPTDEFTSTARIADETALPRPILTKVIARLSHCGLIKTREGRHGGTRLAHPAEETTLRDIVVAFDGGEILPPCPIHTDLCDCASNDPGGLHARWTDARSAAIRFLEETTIAHVAKALNRSKTYPSRVTDP
jgi:Rrf2 family protein